MSSASAGLSIRKRTNRSMLTCSCAKSASNNSMYSPPVFEIENRFHLYRRRQRQKGSWRAKNNPALKQSRVKIFRQTMGGQGYLSRRETIRHRKIPTKPVTIQKLLLRSSSPVINSQPTDRMEARIDRVAVMTRSTFSPLEEKIKNSIKTRASPKRTSVINFSNARYRFFLATNHPSNGHFLEVSYHTLS